ncbi:hypothetical protein BH10ACI4_BH10ACI4_21560 [soil metagenome]
MQSPFFQLLQSNNVSPQTRRVLEDRLALQDYQPAFFTPQEWHLVQLLADAILPQASVGTNAPCAAMIDQSLTKEEGSGWRYATLPPAPEAYRTALRCIAENFHESDPAARHQQNEVIDLLHRIHRKELDTTSFPISLWLEGFKFDVVRYWLASPETMAALDYRGFADDNLTPQDSLNAGPVSR